MLHRRRIGRPTAGAGYNGPVCTVSWFFEAEGYQLFFNRDERRTRKRALPPSLREDGPLPYIAPRDGDFGGSWIGVNSAGLALGLLNGYTEASEIEPANGFISRGLLLNSLLDCRSTVELAKRLGNIDTDRYRSFLLLALEPVGRGSLATWSHGSLRNEPLTEEHVPLVSSSFATEEVRGSRIDLFRRMRRAWSGDRSGLHLAYHESHRPAAGPYSPCMHRPDAKTVSFSWIHVGPRRIRFRYAPHSPCGGRPGDPVEMSS